MRSVPPYDECRGADRADAFAPCAAEGDAIADVRSLLLRERAARAQAEATVHMQNELLALISHDLRTPLAAIMMWAQMLTDGRLDAAQSARGVRAILSSAESQKRLIEYLLDVTRMVTGKLRIAPKLQPLLPIVLQALALERPAADAKGVRFAVDAEAGPDLVCVDAERAQQIFANVIGNAVKFTQSGGMVTLRMAHELEWTCVRVQDDGQGIAPERLPHVFDRFREAGPPSRSHGGFGLAIVRALVELHDGTVEASSEGQGKGALFTIRLPAAVPLSIES